MDVATKLQLSRALRSEAKLLLATMSQAERAVLIEQRPGAPPKPILDEEADRLVQLGLAVRTPYGVDLTMLGRVAARVAYEARGAAPALGVRRA
jgi:hypothetical protein